MISRKDKELTASWRGKTLADALKAGWKDNGRVTWERGYISRRATYTPETIIIMGAYGGQLYYNAPSYTACRYMHRCYMTQAAQV